MAEPVYRIYYGKYPDKLDHEIPNEHIVSVSGLQFRMEPGKPGEPIVDEINFTLENLDHNADERYPRQWFEDNARSAAEGATVPIQLFFKVELSADYGNIGFTGVARNKKYAKYRETVNVTIKDPRDLIKEGDVYMLRPFSFENGFLRAKENANNWYMQGYDLNDAQVTDERLQFTVLTDFKGSYDELEFDHPYAEHRGLNTIIENTTDPHADEPAGFVGESYIWLNNRPAWIQIGENTILTRLQERIWIGRDTGGYFAWLRWNIVHANNGNYSTDDRLVYERGRFYPDDPGSTFDVGSKYTVKIFDYNHGNQDDILVHKDDTSFNNVMFVNGCEVEQDSPTNGEYSIVQTLSSHFDQISKVGLIFEDRLYNSYYNDPSNIDLIDWSKAPGDYRYAFWADLMMYGWMDTEPTDILVNLAMQTNCYLYFNEEGQITFQDRAYHDRYLPDSLPPDAFEVDLADIEPLGDYEEDHGFDSYEIEVRDRIEINNVESEEAQTFHVGPDGVRNSPALRSESLTIENYRTSDLGVPAMNSTVELPKFRYSPASSNFPGIPGVVENLNDFIPSPIEQAQRFASSWSYPTVLWKIQWSMPKYPQAGIGKHFWVDWGSEKLVYLIKDITHDPDKLLHRMEVQEVGVYNG